jgi:hypothetical protein
VSTTARKSGAQQSRPQNQAITLRAGTDPRGARSWRLLAGAVGAIIAVAALLTWALSGDDDAAPAGTAADQFMHVHGLETPAWSADGIFLSTHQGLIKIVGDEWTYVSELPHDFMGFAAHPTESDVLYSSGHPAPGSLLRNPIGFMVSTDAGATWEVRSLEGEADFHAMAVGAAGDVIYGWNIAGEAKLYRSIDDGATWDRLDTPELHAAGGVLTLTAHPDDPDVVWAGTPAGLYRSTDQGMSWDAAATTPATAIAIDPADPDRILTYAPPPGDGLLESADGGQTWVPSGWLLDADDDAVGHLAVDSADPQVIYAGTYREDVYRSVDGGVTWESLAGAGVPTR